MTEQRRRAFSPKRMVYLDAEVDHTMSRTRRELTSLFQDDPEKPILLVISSFGGSIAGMHALMDRIQNLRASGAKIDCLIEGYAMSAGLIIAQVCDHRYMGANAKLMAHGITMGFMGGYDIEDLEKRVVEAQKDTRRVAAIFGRRTRQGAEEWYTLFQSNEPHYYRAEEALGLGLVDEVLEDVI